jgi:hypothetical protein
VEVEEDAGVELFYYFVQAESGAAAAADDTPFLFWLTGGDRCSVFSGLAYEIGTPSIWMMHGVGVSDFDLPCVKNKMLDALSRLAGPIRFVLEPYNGTLPRLRYNHNSWSKVKQISLVSLHLYRHDTNTIRNSLSLSLFPFLSFDTQTQYSYSYYINV